MIDQSSTADYIYAKTSGRLPKSFVGKRANKLFQVKDATELWQLVFNSEMPIMPEKLLVQEIEKQSEKQFIEEYISFLSLFSKPEPVSVQLLRSYDYANLKRINFALCCGEKNIPALTDIGFFSEVKYTKWPDLLRMTKETPFEWFRIPVSGDEAAKFEHKLDTQYIHLLLEAINNYSGEKKQALESLIVEELKMNNIIWAIRLKLYYNMKTEDIIEHLVWSGKKGRQDDDLASPALEVLEIPLDSYNEWKNWKYFELLNPEEDGASWVVDPRWIQRMFEVNLSKRALHVFHQFSSSSLVLVPWFKIRQHELDCIRTAAERFCLNVESEKAKAFAGVD